MSYVISLLLFVITTLVGVIIYFGKKFIEWAKVKIDEHITGENDFRSYVKAEINVVNTSIDYFMKDLKPILDSVERIPEIEKDVSEIKIDIFKMKKHTNYKN